jgi:RNA polymerase sigma-B factor
VLYRRSQRVSELLDDESAQQDTPPRVRSATPRGANGQSLADGHRHVLSRLDPAALWSMRDRDPRGPAREELARRYLPLARKLAARYANPNEPLEDLMQVASLGLLKAIDRYSPERGIPFSSFAVPTILGELKRHFRDTGWSVHVPRDAKELALRVDRASREMAGRLGRSPQVDELAQFLELSVEDVVAALEAANAHFGASLDAPASASDPDAGPLVEMLGSEDDGFSLAETALDLGAAVRRLPYLERRALVLRFSEDLKQTEIAERLGCSQMQVSRLLARATRRLAGRDDPKR